jgi:hypothetical protein
VECALKLFGNGVANGVRWYGEVEGGNDARKLHTGGLRNVRFSLNTFGRSN